MILNLLQDSGYKSVLTNSLLKYHQDATKASSPPPAIDLLLNPTPPRPSKSSSMRFPSSPEETLQVARDDWIIKLLLKTSNILKSRAESLASPLPSPKEAPDNNSASAPRKSYNSKSASIVKLPTNVPRSALTPNMEFAYDSLDWLQALLDLNTSIAKLSPSQSSATTTTSSSSSSSSSSRLRLRSLDQLAVFPDLRALPTLSSLRVKFSAMDPENYHLPVDADVKPWLAAHSKAIQEALHPSPSATSSPSTRPPGVIIPPDRVKLIQLLRHGATVSQRALVWANALYAGGLDPNWPFSSSDLEEWNTLTASVPDPSTPVSSEDPGLEVDPLIYLDIDNTLADDAYFVFEPLLRSVLAASLRDSSLPSLCAVPPSTGGPREALPKSIKRSLNAFGAPLLDLIPPCGWLPHQGSTLYMAPLGYLYDNPQAVYLVWKAMYTRYWVRLTSWVPQQGSMLGLCAQFESLLLRHAPRLVRHSVEVLGVRPLTVSFPWLMYAFVGYLDPAQILSLWDRIISYDSLEILPVAAVSIWIFRARHILAASAPSQLDEVFVDGTKLDIITLIQTFLFASHSKLAGVSSELLLDTEGASHAAKNS